MTRLRAVPGRPRRAIGYIRVSMAREEMVSPELQRTAIERHCEQTGLVLVDVIEELDVSGRSFARAGVIDAIERIERNEADAIVVWKVSRFGRTRRDWYVHADRVEVAGGTLESATESFDPLTSTGRLTRGMLVELAAWESDVKSEQWKEAHEHRFAAGKPHSPSKRFGYRYNPETDLHEIDPVEGPLLAGAYERFIAGEPPMTICRWLNSVGARTTTGAEWHPNTMRPLLAKGFGAGFLYRRNTKSLVRGAHEPVIDEKTWQAYQRRRSLSAREPARTRQAIHPLTGLVVCARPVGEEICGKTMNVWQGWQDGRFYIAYKCYRGCGRNYAAMAALHDAVKTWLADEVAEDLDARAATKAQQMAKRTLAKAERAGIEKSVRDLEKSLLRLTDAFARGITPESAYTAAVAAIQDEKDGLERRLAEVYDDESAARVNPRGLARKILADYDTLVEQDPPGMREVLRTLVREIRVLPGSDTPDRFEVIPRWT